MLIEVQYERRHDYLSRTLYGSARTLVEHLDAGEPYAHLVKVISVNILYFDPRDTLDEWVYFLTHEAIQDGFSAKGLREAKEKLDVLKLAPAERAAYERWQDDLHLQASLVASNYGLGKIEGREEGRQEGRDKGREERTLEIARAMKANGVAPGVIAQSTGLDHEVIADL